MRRSAAGLLFLIGILILAVAARAQFPGQGAALMVSSGSGQTIASMSLSNSTFTNNTANGAVGNVSVVMNPATPAFTGTLSLSGANTGGFQLVGNALQANSAGTTSGTFSDVTIGAAQPGSGSFSITPTLVGGSGMACDFGPSTTLPTGTVGTDLATAGFTHCALNANFSDTSGTTGGNGWIMNTPSTYVGSCGTSAWGQLWFKWVNGAALGGDAASPGGDAPCNRLSLVVDGSNGTVLTYQFANSDIVKGSSQLNSRIGLGLWWPLCGDSCSSLRPALPNAHYTEFTYRVSPTSVIQNPGQIFDASEESIFDGDTVQGPGGGEWLDSAVIESQANSSGIIAGGTNLSLDHYSAGGNSKSTANFSWTPDTTNMHTFGYLTSTDGSTAINTCVYYDGGNITKTGTSGWTNGTSYCSHWLGTFGSYLLADHDNRIWKFIGAFSNFPFTGVTLGNPITIFIKSIRVFTCATYRGVNNNCTGTLVYH